jgi:hypothetical protein
VGPADQNNPTISGSVVVWLEGDSQSMAIRGLDLASGQALEVTSTPADGRSAYYPPALDGNIVVYAEVEGTPKIPAQYSHVIYAYDFRTGIRTMVGQARWLDSEYAVSGHRVAWSAGGVHVFDLTTGHDTLLLAGCYPTTLDIEGNLVVWADPLPGSDRHRLAGYDLAKGAAFLISDAPGDQAWPRLSGTTVVWMSFTFDDLANIALRQLTADLPPLSLLP